MLNQLKYVLCSFGIHDYELVDGWESDIIWLSFCRLTGKPIPYRSKDRVWKFGRPAKRYICLCCGKCHDEEKYYLPELEKIEAERRAKEKRAARRKQYAQDLWCEKCE